MFTLIGLFVLLLGFALRLNPLLVAATAALASALAAGLSPIAAVSALGRAFNEGRTVSLVWIILPLIGLLEGRGLRAQARSLVLRLRGRRPGRLLVLYLLARQITAALGLTALGGHAAMVRPMIAPMAEAAAGEAGEPLLEEVRAQAAAADNIGAFFGEDVFIAFGSVLLIQASLKSLGYGVAAFSLSAWALPTAVLAFLIHGARLLGLDRRVRRALLLRGRT
jgi:uncharacterized membrane protein